MDPNHYRFRAVWPVAAPPSRVYAALERLDAYPAWWPQVRGFARTGEDSGLLRIRAALPYRLSIALHARRRDPAAGILEVGMSGDLVGWACWSVRAADGGSVALFAQDVEVERRLLRMLAVPARPLFVANHRLMMRGGLHGLRTLLERGLDEE
ncbi:SRPBCC family protein [Streptomyces sp. NPDC006990]|uniref:SRPBCC family protein n=1 Tax=Streptomyces sp. NPDC006990 TaxID=3154481 RepID=UPI003454E08D